MCLLLDFSVHRSTAMSMLGNTGSCSHRLKQIVKWIGHDRFCIRSDLVTSKTLPADLCLQASDETSPLSDALANVSRLEFHWNVHVVNSCLSPLMDVLARRVEPAQGDLCQLWSKSIHGGNTLDSFVVDLGSALEDALVLLSTSTPTSTSTSTLEGSTVRSQKPEQESLESPDNAFDNDQSPQKVPSWSFHGSCENLISAMKGSRKEHGKDVGKLRVSWATDVYDPPITSQSHAVGSNHKQYSSSSRHRKNLKNNKNKAKLHRSSRKSKGSLSR